MGASIKSIAVTSILIAAAGGFYVGAARGDDCTPVMKAELATVTAPGFRQYLSFSGGADGKDEKLLSIALGDTVYIATGGPGSWQKMERKEIIAMAKQAADDARYRDCRSLGSEPVGGVATAAYAFTMESRSKSFAPSHGKVWIGNDGLLRKQATDQGSLRYEYDNLEAPIP